MADVLLALKQLWRACGYGAVETGPRDLDAARKAIHRLPSIDVPHPQENCYKNTVLHSIVDAAARDEESDASWRKTPAKEKAERRRFMRELVAFILAQGANVHTRNARDETPLHLAAQGDPKIVELLLAAGADPNGVASEFTPLMNACIATKPNAKTIELLLAAGADPTATVNGRTARRMVGNKHPEVARLLRTKPDATTPKPSRDPVRDARAGNIDALFALADDDAPDNAGAFEAYKWLCAAADFGHAKAALRARDVLETSLYADDGGLLQGDAHAELGLHYLEGAEGLPKDLSRARDHLQFCTKVGTDLASHATPKLRKRLADDARAVLDSFVKAKPKR